MWSEASTLLVARHRETGGDNGVSAFPEIRLKPLAPARPAARWR
jgi:hypothetical protein